jgi:hypothetical protein
MTLIQPGDSMAGQQGPAGSRLEAAPLKKGSLSTVAIGRPLLVRDGRARSLLRLEVARLSQMCKRCWLGQQRT